MDRYSEIYDVGPQYCPQCAARVEDFIWLHQNKYYCSQAHVPRTTKTYTTLPRLQTGAIDWEAYYAGYYGRRPGGAAS